MSRALALLAIVAAFAFAPGGATAAGRDGAARSPPATTSSSSRRRRAPGVGLRQSPYFTRNDCGFAEVRIDGAQESDDVTAVLTGADGSALGTEPADVRRRHLAVRHLAREPTGRPARSPSRCASATSRPPARARSSSTSSAPS